MSHFDRFVGIDISKNRLDIYCHPDRLAFCVANTSDGIGQLLEHVPKKLFDFFDQDMLQHFDFELRPYRSNDPFDRDAL